MDPFIPYFQDISPVTRAAILVGGLMFFWVLEGLIPLFRFRYNKVRHAGINLFFTALWVIIGFGSAILLLQTSDYVTSRQFGLLYLIQIPVWAKVILGVLLLDFIGAYFIHWLSHKIKWMWKFHIIHHADMEVDVTTGLRHHPGEIIFRITFLLIGVFVTGASMGIIMLYQTISGIFAQITHANIKMPDGVDKVLSYLFVTPNFHKVHHHYKQPFTDSNYGNIFSIWDRILGTAKEVKTSNELIYGIDTHLEPEENAEIKKLLKIPFQAYRPPPGSKFSEDTTQ